MMQMLWSRYGTYMVSATGMSPIWAIGPTQGVNRSVLKWKVHAGHRARWRSGPHQTRQRIMWLPVRQRELPAPGVQLRQRVSESSGGSPRSPCHMQLPMPDCQLISTKIDQNCMSYNAVKLVGVPCWMTAPTGAVAMTDFVLKSRDDHRGRNDCFYSIARNDCLGQNDDTYLVSTLWCYSVAMTSRSQ